MRTPNAMRNATGSVLVVQEGRFRLLTDDGRGMVFVLAHDAPIEPQDLPPLTHRRVRVDYDDGPNLVAGVARDLVVLEERRARP
jgi:hypothetical protein